MVSPIRWGVVALVLLGVLSCAPGADREPFLLLAGPEDVIRVDVEDEAGEVLWILEATSPQPVEAFFYGEVPDGFRQLEPAEGSLPRSLQPGESVIARTTTRTRLFTHSGVAKSATAMEIFNYSMGLRAVSDEE